MVRLPPQRQGTTVATYRVTLEFKARLFGLELKSERWEDNSRGTSRCLVDTMIRLRAMIVSISRLVLLLVTISTVTGCTTNASSSLPQRLNIEVTGSDFEWHVRYAGPDETFRTPDDYVTRRNITLMTGIPTTIFLRSDDYVYSFALPHLGLKEIAVPDLEFSLEFPPRNAWGVYPEG